MTEQPLLAEKNRRRLLCLCICTRGRPEMLVECLESVARQPAVPGWEWELIVVENDIEERCRQIVMRDWHSSARHVDYLLEPALGIPQARNAAVEAAYARGADWIAFVDDDETLADDWLPEMIMAIDRHSADVISAPVILHYDDPDAFWALESPQFEEGAQVPHSASGNVAFQCRLVAPEPVGFGLRFDESFRFLGGEDLDFFGRAAHAGARMVWSNGPQAFERQRHGRRATFRGYFSRMFSYGYFLAIRAVRRDGYWAAVRAHGPSGLAMLLKSSLRVGLSVCYWRLTDRDIYRQRLRRKVGQIATGAGQLGALMGLTYRPYRDVDGF